MYIPGGEKKWVAALPDPFDKDPMVVIVSTPRGAVSRVGMVNGKHLWLLETKRGPRGLHVVGHDGNWMDHREIIEDAVGIQMADPSYIGRLSECTPRVLLDELVSLVFLRDHLGREHLNLKSFLWSCSHDSDTAIN